MPVVPTLPRDLLHCRQQAYRALDVATYNALLPAEGQARAATLRSVIAAIEARAVATRGDLVAIGYGRDPRAAQGAAKGVAA